MQEEEGTPNLKYYRLGGSQQEQIDTSSIKKELPDIEFIYCLEINGVPDRENRHSIKNILFDSYDDDDRDVRTVDVLQHNILDGLNRCGIIEIQSLKYFEASQRIWHQFPPENSISFKSTLSYEYKHIDDQNQGRDKQRWIVDLLVKEKLSAPNKSEPCCKDASSKLNRLETLMKGIGQSIVDHFQNDDIVPADPSSGGSSQPEEDKGEVVYGEVIEALKTLIHTDNPRDTPTGGGLNTQGKSSPTPTPTPNNLKKQMSEQMLNTSQLSVQPKLITSQSMMSQLSRSQFPSTVDLAFLFSEPLLQHHKNTIIPFLGQPLDLKAEFINIFDAIKNNTVNKKFVMRKVVATYQNLQVVMTNFPKIIHISCHGACDNNNQNTYNLKFEDPDKICMSDDLTEERLSDLMGPQINHKVQVVFISACHSETLGQLFKRMGVPIVIAVNKLTPVLDSVSQNFAKHFYIGLVAGNSPQIAFDNSIRLVKAGKINAFACCCNHQHKHWCKWVKYFKDQVNSKTGQEAHNAHTHSKQECKCNLKLNQHKKETCLYAKKFKKDFNLTFEEQEQFNSFIIPSFNKIESVCCCSPELTHDENNKFQIIRRYPSQQLGEINEDYFNPSCLTIQQAEYLNKQDEEILNQPLFNLIKKGTCELLNDKALINQLDKSIDSNYLVGRNVIISDIVEFIKKHEHRLLHLYGPQGYGKKDIANFAGHHAMERVQLDGAMYIAQKQEVTSVQGLIEQICLRFNENSKFNSRNTKEHIIKTIGEKRYLFIIKRFEDIKEVQNNEQNIFIEELISKITNTQFIIITLSKNSIQNQQRLPMLKMEIPPLTKENAALLMIKNSNGRINFSEFKNNECLLAEHQIFQKIPILSPSVIVEMCDRMIDSNQSLNDLLKQENEKQQKQMNQQENQILIDARNAQWDELIKKLPVQNFLDEYKLLYILCQMPDGLFESDIDQIWSVISTKNTNNWKIFFKKISKSTNSVEMILNEDAFEEQKGDSQIILNLFEYYQDLEIKQFILRPLFRTLEIIKSQVKQDQYQIEFEQFLNYMSNLSTHIVQNLTLDKHNDVDISNVSTIKINQKAFWYIDYCKEIMLQQHPDPNNQQFQYMFLYYLPNLLKIILESSQANIENTDSIQQICINSVSILLHLYQIDNARKTIIQCEQIAKKYNISSLIAKLGVLLGSVTIKTNEKYESTDIFNKLQFSISFFKKQILYCEGMAEALYLQAVIKIENIMQSLDNKEELKISQIQSSQYDSHKFNVTDGLKFKEYQLHNINKPQQQIVDQLISEISQILGESRKIFNKSSKYKFGNAKTLLIEAEILIQFKFNNSTEIIPKDVTPLLEDIIKISNQLLQSFKIFESLQLINLSARSFKSLGLLLYKLLQNKAIMEIIETDESKIKLSEIEFIDNIHSYRDIAIYMFGSALEIYEKTDNQVEIEEIQCIIKTIEIDYKKLFCFGSAQPLVEEFDGIEYAISVGAVTRVHSNFKDVLIHNIKQSETILNVQFNQLNKQFLENIKNNCYKILHITSAVFDSNNFCIEGEHGKQEKINVADLKKLLQHENGNPLDIELVVLAMPESHQIAKVFQDLGVKHVVSFSFKYFVQYSRFIVRAYEYIEDFCQNLYRLLLCNKVNLLHAFDTAMKESFQNTLLQSLEEFTRHEFLQHREFQQEELQNNQGPKIQSNQQAQYQFFEQKQHNFKSKNLLIDYTNFNFSSSESKDPITGRQCFIYELIQHFVNRQNKILNIYGKEGIGKTRIAIEVYEFLKQRNYYDSKVCYVDFYGVNTLEDFKEKTTKDLLQFQEKLKIIDENQILLIIDHINVSIEIDALKYIINLQKNFRKIILTRKCIQQYDIKNDDIVLMEVPKLDIDQSIDLIQSICERSIYDQIDQVSNEQNIQYKSVFEYLNKNKHVHNCNGLPKYLLKLSYLMQYSNLEQINIMDVVTSSVLPMIEKSNEQFEYQELMDFDQDYFLNNAGYLEQHQEYEYQLQHQEGSSFFEMIKNQNGQDDEEMKDDQNIEWEQPQAGDPFWNIVDMSPSKIKHGPNEISSQLSQSSFSIDSDAEDNNKIEKKIMRKSPNPISEIKKEKSKLNEENAKD